VSAVNLTPSRRRADEFARLLDGGGRTDDPGLAPLVTLATALQALPLGPTPDFRAGLRQRLVAVAAVQTEPAPTPGAGEKVREWASSWRTQRRLALAAGGLAAVTAIAGIGISGSRSLPGEPFYAVKSAAERLQLATTSGDLDRGKLHLAFARARMSEVRALSDGTNASVIVTTLRRMDRETRTGTTDLTQAWHDTGSIDPITALQSFAQRQTADLTAVLPALPAAAKAQADQSLALLRGVNVVVAKMQAASCLTGCSGSTGSAPGTSNGSPSNVAPSAGTGARTGTSPGAGIGTGTGTGTTLPGTSSTGTGSTTGIAPGIGTSTNPLPIPTLSPVPTLTTSPLPTLSTAPLPTSTSLPTLSTAPLPSASTTSILPGLPPLPLPSTSLGLP
jgi:hypothetical protein